MAMMSFIISLELVKARGNGPKMLQSGKSVFHQVPIAIQPSIQIPVSLERVTLARNDDLTSLLCDLGADRFAVIPLVRDDGFGTLHLGDQRCRLRAVIDLATWHVKRNR